MRTNHESSVFMGLITARSVEDPSPPDEINYSIQVEHEDGVTTFDAVVPQEYFRDYPVDIDLVPFPVGMSVPVGVIRLGATEVHRIMAGERPDVGECEA